MESEVPASWQTCLFCSGTSLERSRKPCSSIVPGMDGLVCSLCKRFSCSDCLANLQTAIEESQIQHNCPRDHFFDVISDYNRNGVYPTNYVGHCCELKQEALRAGTFLKANYRKQCQKEMSCDGYVFFPQFKLLIDTPFGDIDVLGLGPIKGSHHGVWHCVIGIKDAIRFAAEGLSPQAWNPSMATCMKRTSINIPFPNMCKKGCMKLNVEYCIIDQSCVFDKERKGWKLNIFQRASRFFSLCRGKVRNKSSCYNNSWLFYFLQALC